MNKTEHAEIYRDLALLIEDILHTENLRGQNKDALLDAVRAFLSADLAEDGIIRLLELIRCRIGADSIVLLRAAGKENSHVVAWSSPVHMPGQPWHLEDGIADKPRNYFSIPSTILADGKPANLTWKSMLLKPAPDYRERRLTLIALSSRDNQFEPEHRQLLRESTRIIAHAARSVAASVRLRVMHDVVNEADEAFIIVDATTDNFPIMFVNTAFRRLFRLESERLVDRPLGDILDIAGLEDACRKVAASFVHDGQDGRHDFAQPVMVMGHEMQVSVKAAHKRDTGRNMLVIKLADISQFLALQADRDAVHIRLSTAIQASGVGYALVGPLWTILEASPAWCAFFGQRAENWPSGANILALLMQVSPGFSLAEFRSQAMNFDDNTSGEMRRLEVTSTAGRVGMLSVHRTNENGAILHLVDVTPLRRAQADLMEKIEAIEASNDGIAITDQDGRYVYMNMAHARMFGFRDPDDAMGHHWSEIYWPGEIQRLQAEAFPALETHGNWRGEAIGHTLDGVPVEQEINLTLRDNGSIVCTTRNIAERRYLERERDKLIRELTTAQRHELISQLTSGFAHDFNNMLSVIKGSAQLIRENGDPESKAAAERIQKAGELATAMVRRILDMGRQQRYERRELDLGPIITDVASLLRAALTPSQSIECIMPDAPVKAVADPNEIAQIILNLGINARDALGNKAGRIDIILSDLPPQDHAADITLGTVPDGPAISIAVKDNGSGIRKEDFPAIFEPFFTTKPVTGTGLGLPVISNIVRAAGGAVKVSSREGHGTLFEVLWPMVPRERKASARIPADATTAPAASLNGFSILLVDDDQALLEHMADRLSALGAEVAPTIYPSEALEVLREHPSFWTVVITDLEMLAMTGTDFARKVREIRPDLPVLLCSASPDADLELHGENTPFRGLIRKPVNWEHCSNMIVDVTNVKNNISKVVE